jgi:hypothetical protein
LANYGFLSFKTRALRKTGSIDQPHVGLPGFIINDSFTLQSSQHFLNSLRKVTVDEVGATALGQHMVERRLANFATKSELKSASGYQHEVLVALVKDEIAVLRWWFRFFKHTNSDARIATQSFGQLIGRARNPHVVLAPPERSKIAWLIGTILLSSIALPVAVATIHYWKFSGHRKVTEQ